MFTLIRFLVFLGSRAFVPKIVNGDDVKIEDYPYQISLEIDGSHQCGGSIISTTRILTAAHCTDKYSTLQITIRAGSSIREQGGQVPAISENHVHPEWDNRPYDNDVAVLVFSEPLVVNNQVQIAQLAVDDNQPVGSFATITDWGITENETLATTLQKQDLEKISEEKCESQYSPFYNPVTQICYGDEPGKTSCSADSGGPLVQNGVQVGIASYSSCDGSTASGYVKVSYYLSYIQNLM